MRPHSFRPLVTAVVVAALAMTLTAIASAAGNAGAASESGVAGNIQNALQPTKSSGGTLPFTGVELSLVVAAAIGLALVGVLMRRAGRERG